MIQYFKSAVIEICVKMFSDIFIKTVSSGSNFRTTLFISLKYLQYYNAPSSHLLQSVIIISLVW
jgi:hypothetical protein